MIRTLTTAAALATALSAGAAVAQDAPAPAGDWSFVVGAATDNRSRDISRSEGEPFVWGRAEWTSASGLFYAAPAFETVRGSTGSELEVEAAAGIRPQVAGFDLDLNVAYKYQLDADPGADHDAWNFTADAHRSIGPASARLRLQYSPDGVGPTGSWTWVEARLGWDVTDRLQATAAIGRREQTNNLDYTGWNAGVAYALTRNLEAELRYHSTDANAPGETYGDALVAGISFAF